MPASIPRALTLLLSLSALARMAASQTPRRMADVPLPAGARADTVSAAPGAEPPCWTEECRTHLVHVAVEDVFRFYEQRLGALPSGDRDAEAARDSALERVAQRGATPAFYQLKTWSQFLASAAPGARRMYDPVLAQVRKRPPYRPDEWLCWIRLAWAARASDGDTGGALIAVRGAAPWPELGLTVQPNVGTYPSAVKTMITVRRGIEP